MAPRKTRTVSQEYFIRASLKKVFAAISDPERLTRWMVSEATVSPRKGGDYSLTWKAGYHHEGKVLEFVRGKRITLAWPYHDGTKLLGVTRFQLSVRPEGDGTLLKVQHSGFPRTEAWVDIYAGSGAGWAYYMMNLKSVLEHGNDLRSMHHWMER